MARNDNGSATMLKLSVSTLVGVVAMKMGAIYGFFELKSTVKSNQIEMRLSVDYLDSRVERLEGHHEQ